MCLSLQEANGLVSPGEHNGAGSIVPETLVSSGKAERNLENALLDERSLLTCILRTIPAGGRIRISSTVRANNRNHNESEQLNLKMGFCMISVSLVQYSFQTVWAKC